VLISDTPQESINKNLGKGEGTLAYKLRQRLKRLLFQTSLAKRFVLNSPGGLHPAQLYFIMDHILKYRSPDRSYTIAEVGIARGLSTRFLYDFMTIAGGNFEYDCIDTFSGFDKDSIRMEVRRKGPGYAWDNYDYLNILPYIRKSEELGLSNLRFVKASQYSQELRSKRFDLVILDVDVEMATTEYLSFFFQRLDAKGLILVDDCALDNKYDGALVAYKEFCTSRGIQLAFLHPKSGLVYGSELAPILPQAAFTEDESGRGAPGGVSQ
jgi:hypothetical protein